MNPACGLWFSESNFLSDKSLTTRIIMETLFLFIGIGFRRFLAFFFFGKRKFLLKMSLLRGFNQEDYTGWIRAKMVNKWAWQIFDKQELEKQQVNGLELQQETEGVDTGAQPVIIISPNSPPPSSRLSTLSPLNNVYCQSACRQTSLLKYF